MREGGQVETEREEYGRRERQRYMKSDKEAAGRDRERRVRRERIVETFGE